MTDLDSFVESITSSIDEKFGEAESSGIRVVVLARDVEGHRAAAITGYGEEGAADLALARAGYEVLEHLVSLLADLAMRMEQLHEAANGGKTPPSGT